MHAFYVAQYLLTSWLITYVGRKYVNLTGSFVLGKCYLADSFAFQQNGHFIHVATFKDLIILWIVASFFFFFFLLHHALVF